jgi:hypothetical protein
MPEPGVRNGWQAFEQVYFGLIEDTNLHWEQETSVEERLSFVLGLEGRTR